MARASERPWYRGRRCLSAAGGAAAALLALYGLTAFLIADGMTSAERGPQEDHPGRYGLVPDDVEFASRRGDVLLRGWYLAGAPAAGHGAARGEAALIFVHGLSSVRSSDAAVGLAARLVGLGYSVLLFDLRGHGSSGGTQVSGGYFERWDVLGAYDYLVSERGYAAGEVGLVGFSMGAATAVLAAELEPGIAAVVADSPYASASELLANEAARQTPLPRWATPLFMPLTEVIADRIHGIDIGALKTQRAAARLRYPLLVVHGDADTRIPVDHGERVAAAAPAGTVWWRTSGVDHADSFTTYPDEYVERVASYLMVRLPRTGRRGRTPPASLRAGAVEPDAGPGRNDPAVAARASPAGAVRLRGSTRLAAPPAYRRGP